MRSVPKILVLIAALLSVGAAQAADPVFARLDTEEGVILLVLYPELAPHHVDNFVHLARTGFYDGTTFHRIVPGFVIQGGDPNSRDDDPRNDGMGGPTLMDVLNEEELAKIGEINAILSDKGYQGLDGPAQLKAEFSKTVKHLRGSLSMARSRDVNSAGSQFFICVNQTPPLDGQYTIFGHVVMGMEVADTIVKADKNHEAGRDAPADPVAITKVTIMTGTGELTEAEQAAWNEFPEDMRNLK